MTDKTFEYRALSPLGGRRVLMAALMLCAPLGQAKEPDRVAADPQSPEAVGTPALQQHDTLPAWREPDFVMDEVVVTVAEIGTGIETPQPVAPDLKAMLELHLNIRPEIR